MPENPRIIRKFRLKAPKVHSLQFEELPEAEGRPVACQSVYVKRTVIGTGKVTRTFNKAKDCKGSVQFKEQAAGDGAPEAIGSLYLSRALGPAVDKAASIDVTIDATADSASLEIELVA